MSNGIHGMNPCHEEVNPTFAAQCLNTVEENMQYLSPWQLKQAKKVQKLYKALGTPTVSNLKAMIKMNLIKNNKVSTEDVNLAKKAFGPDASAIKGKTT
eukprot:13070544-Ditylum_brightwellii.AAC.1